MSISKIRVMVLSAGARMQRLELQVEELHVRVKALEAELEDRGEAVGAGSPAPAPTAGPSLRPARPADDGRSNAGATPSPAPPAALRSVSVAARRAAHVEDLLGRRVLGLAGGVAILTGLSLLVAVAISRGWMGESARVAIAFLGSSALLAGGARLYGRLGRTQAALSAVGTGIAGQHLSLAAPGCTGSSACPRPWRRPRASAPSPRCSPCASTRGRWPPSASSARSSRPWRSAPDRRP